MPMRQCPHCSQNHPQCPARRDATVQRPKQRSHLHTPGAVRWLIQTTHKKGGAGAAAFLVDQQQMRLLDWQAMAIAACPDNIYAETIACEQATLLAAEWYAKLAPDGKLAVIIQGDILPLIQFLNYNARLRYAGVQQHLINIKQTALLQLPTHTFAYLPREGNAIADHLAGVGAEMPPPAKGVDIHSHTPLPASLLNKVKMYHLPQEQSLTLHERPHIHHPPLAAY